MFLQLCWITYWEQRENLTILKIVPCRKYSFPKLTQYSQWNKVLDAPSSIKDCFLWEIHVFLQLNCIDLFGTQRDYLHLENRKMQRYAFQKLIQFSQGNNVLDAPTSNADGFVSKDTCVFSRCWTDLCRTKWAFLHLEYSGWQHVFLSKPTWIHTWQPCAPCFCF